MMKYPKLKCEDKRNTVVCSLTIKKMKEMRKRGLTYSKIGNSLKIGTRVVAYHISPTMNSPEKLEKRRKYSREYIKRRYNNDPQFRRNMLDSINKHHRDKRANDPKFKKWQDQMSVKNTPIWVNKQEQKHPTWSYTCARGVHETVSSSSGCKNKAGNCKCPCHRK